MTEKVLRLQEVKLLTGLSRSSIYAGASTGEFPKPIKLTKRSSGWLQSEVDNWLSNRVLMSRTHTESSL